MKTKRVNYTNRHTDGMPKEACIINVIVQDSQGEHIYLCEWLPFKKEEYTQANMPSEGYLGTARVVEGAFKGIGFNVWEQNNSEFVWYNIVKITNEDNN